MDATPPHAELFQIVQEVHPDLVVGEVTVNIAGQDEIVGRGVAAHLLGPAMQLPLAEHAGQRQVYRNVAYDTALGSRFFALPMAAILGDDGQLAQGLHLGIVVAPPAGHGFANPRTSEPQDRVANAMAQRDALVRDQGHDLIHGEHGGLSPCRITIPVRWEIPPLQAAGRDLDDLIHQSIVVHIAEARVDVDHGPSSANSLAEVSNKLSDVPRSDRNHVHLPENRQDVEPQPPFVIVCTRDPEGPTLFDEVGGVPPDRDRPDLSIMKLGARCNPVLDVF
ncbi:MAG: hypothetical protein HY903_20025 [Deltaproteobacteria bacterium]|nr:hypothetical protein [Deltaproteobacteria bacterium]